MNLADVTTDELKRELAKRGFQTDNLWCIADVESNLEGFNEDRKNPVSMTDDEKMELLIDVMGGDGTMQAINETISYILTDKYPEEEQD